MSAPLRVLVVTDSFPPICGGSGWSTWEVARGLSARGHHVEVVKAEAGPGPGIVQSQMDSIHVTTFRSYSPDVPIVRNVMKNERLWDGLATYLLKEHLKKSPFDIIHAQHVMTTVPAIRAGEATGTPVVATVRDYWPVCFWSNLIIDPKSPHLCPACTVRNMTRCVKPRAGAGTVAAWSVIPYMRLNLGSKRTTLARASAIIAVSTTIARDLRERAPEIDGTPLFTIPNPVDMTALDAVHAHVARPLEGPYVLYAGKLAINKGVQFLIDAYAKAAVPWPLVIVGDGPLQGQLEADGRRRGLDVRELGWRDRQEVWAWMRHATLLAFPSYGPESLSRVLIEASALGVPIAAMNTGGTPDVIQHGETGLLAGDVDAFAADLARLAKDERLRSHLGSTARSEARAKFGTTSVVDRIEHVYRGLLQPRAA